MGRQATHYDSRSVNATPPKLAMYGRVTVSILVELAGISVKVKEV